jgi:superfamily I DNA/RNA helicase
VREHEWKQIDDQTQLLTKAWSELKDRGIKADQLAVLSPYRPENSGGIRALKEVFPGDNFTVSTISGYKGLQSPFVFLVDMNTGGFASREDLWYVGATRATVGLQTFAKN